jgi:chitodextrinase
MALSGDYTVGAGVLTTNISGLLGSTTYAIRVRTVNEDDELSAGNRVLVVKTAAVAAAGPTDPANVRVDTTYPTLNDEVKLVWDAADSNGGSAIDSYRITWDPPYGVEQPYVVADAATTALIPDLYANARFTFKIKAVDVDGVLSPGFASAVAATASNVGPRDPANFSADPGFAPSETEIGLTWNTAQTFGGATLSDYYITWQPPDGTGSTRAGQYDVTKVVSGLLASTTYSFNIVGVDTSGNDSPGNYYVSETTTDIGGLRAPTNFRSVGTPGVTTINTAWNPAIATAPDTVTCNVITAFDISEDFQLAPQTLSGGATSNYTFTDLSSNKPYRFSIEAFSETGSAVGRNTFVQTTSVANAPFDPRLSIVAVGYNYASFEWTLSGDGRNGGANLSDFYIDYSTSGAEPVRRNIAGGASASNATVFNLTPGTGYDFIIYARNLSGLSSPGGADATQGAETASVGSPLAPAGLQAHPYIPATPSSISVMWNSAYKGSPTNPEVTNHIVRINPATDDGSTFDVGEDTTITIGNVAQTSIYSIWVRAVNASGAQGNETGPLTISTPGVGQPGDVGGLRFSGIVGEENIPIAWASSADEATGADISGYEIQFDAV